jgi:hypothetical protein
MFRDQIERGTFLVVIEVGVTSFLEDANVRVHAVLAAAGASSVRSSTVCAANATESSCTHDVTDACNWSGSTSTCAGIAAQQVFVTMTDLGTTWGSIHNGRLEFTIAALPLQFEFTTGGTRTVVLHTVRFGARIRPNSLTEGELGGTVEASLFQQMCPTALCMPPSVAADQQPIGDTRTICTMHADASSCGADTANACHWNGTTCLGVTAGSTCLGVSAGFGFEAVAATLE